MNNLCENTKLKICFLETKYESLTSINNSPNKSLQNKMYSLNLINLFCFWNKIIHHSSWQRYIELSYWNRIIDKSNIKLKERTRNAMIAFLWPTWYQPITALLWILSRFWLNLRLLFTTQTCLWYRLHILPEIYTNVEIKNLLFINM